MKVSVCIPTYNQCNYLEKAIYSAVRQTLTPFEIIVSNDCSTDNTKDILTRITEDVPYLKVINQPHNLGIAKNTDACLRAASGDYIVRLDSDDYLENTYISKLATLLAQNPKSGYAHAAVQEIDQNGKFLNKRKLLRKEGFLSGDDALKAAVMGYRVAANIIMFSRDALKCVNYLYGRPDYVEDYHVTSHIAAAGYGNVYSDEVLSFYRVWVDASKVRQRRKLLEIIGLRRVFDDVIEPGFKERGWKQDPIIKRKEHFASRQANCLSWDVYTKDEKQQLVGELLRLSPSLKTRFYIKLYLSPIGKIVDSMKFSRLLKTGIKKVILAFNKNR